MRIKGQELLLLAAQGLRERFFKSDEHPTRKVVLGRGDKALFWHDGWFPGGLSVSDVVPALASFVRRSLITVQQALVNHRWESCRRWRWRWLSTYSSGTWSRPSRWTSLSRMPSSGGLRPAMSSPPALLTTCSSHPTRTLDVSPKLPRG